MTILLALVLFLGGILLESNFNQTAVAVLMVQTKLVPGNQGAKIVHEGELKAVSAETDLSVGDIIETSDMQTAAIKFSVNGVVRLTPNSKVIFKEQRPEDNSPVFILEKGRVWVNGNFIRAKNLYLLAGGAFLESRKASFDVSFDGIETDLKVDTNQVAVKLVLPDFDTSKIGQADDTAFINSFLVVQGSQARIFADKLKSDAETIKKLLYSKLIKEFQYSLVDPAEWDSDPWLRQNIQLDEDLLKQVAKSNTEEITRRNLKIASLDSLSYQLQKAMGRFANFLTFSADKVAMRAVEQIFDQLKDAEYLVVFGRTTEAKERLMVFKQSIDENINAFDESFKKMVLADLKDEYLQLAYVMPDDPLFDVKTAVVDTLYKYLGDSKDDLIEKFNLGRDYAFYAYKLAQTNVDLARFSLDQYFSRLIDFIKSNKSKIEQVKYLVAEDNQIADNLLRQFYQFYQDSFFARKHQLEQEWLGFLVEGPDKNEEKQTIAGNKIDFLKQLQSFFLDEQLSLKEARLIVLRLISEINELQTSAELGIGQLFALRLKDYGQFLRFLNLTDVSTLQRGSYRSKYEEFLAAQKEAVSIEQAVKEFLGEQATAPMLTVEKILQQAKQDFESSGVSEVTFGEMAGIDQRLISVENAVFKNIKFKAQYDWDRKLISQIDVNGIIVAQEAIRLENLEKVLIPKLPGVKPTQVVTQEQTQQTTETASKADRVAKILLLQKLKANDITASENNIEIKDRANGIFVINGAKLVSNPSIQIAFGFMNKTGIATAIMIRTPLGDKKLEGDLAIADLSAKAKEIYEQDAAAARASSQQ